MEVGFDTRFKHPWSMIISGPSSYGKTVFTKQVLNKSYKQFEKLYWFYSEWQVGYKDCPGISFVSGMPSLLDAYLELSGPKPKSKCYTNSSKRILLGKGNVKRTPQYRVCGAISK